jgi:cyclase
MLTAEGGGNMGLFIGEDGTFLIDDHYAPLSEKISAAISAAGGDTPRFLANTHWHGDHTGGNENFGQQGTLIIAHENVRKRMSVDNFLEAFNTEIPASPPVALPVITLTDEVTFHLNGDSVKIFHVPNAHTDGDSIILFESNNVVHAGDTFFNGFYPFIDTGSGGTLKGQRDAASAILEKIADDTKIIPGHGPLASKADLTAYRDMLAAAYDALSPLKAEGKTVEEAISAKPLAALEADWGGGIFTSDKWIEIIYGGID